MIKENILKIQERIRSVCSKVNRDPESITIVAVSKERTIEQIKEAIQAGITDIGENKVQEAVPKYSQIQTTQDSSSAQADRQQRIKWHMVGHLQTNKVKDAVKIFDLIHSVDSLHLASEINKQASRMNKIQDILVQVNTSGEASKFGAKPEETLSIIKEISELANINIKGLMTIAPLLGNPEDSRSCFKVLREIKDRINESRITNHESRILSMGMTDDFEIAIEEGASMLRLGRVIFEA